MSRGLMCFCAMLLAAIGLQAQQAKELSGTWADPDSQSLVKLEINGLDVHPYGACTPQPCDMGVLHGQPYAADVRGSGPYSMLVMNHASFAIEEMAISLEPDGRLRVQLFTAFRDGSHRANYSVVQYMKRESQ